MPDAPSISRDERDLPGLSYTRLRELGQTLVQQLAGDLWTDYNEHDPGVTILEQLCYALTELSYRAGLPMADLLAGPGGAVELSRQALFSPRDVFPAGPLTPNDYRRLIADRVQAVGNVWFSPRAATKGVRGLYEVTLHVPGAGPCSCADAIDADEVRGQVMRVYAKHRNLCEDLHSVRILEHVRVVVSARVNVDETRAPEAILAEILFRVGLLFAPELRREPLDAQLARGLAPSEIFAGPLLHDGFVDDEQLTERATHVRVADVVRTLARTGGVLSVREVSIGTDAGEVSGNDAVQVPHAGVLALESRPDKRGRFSFRLFRQGALCKVDPARVRRELERRWADQRRRFPLSAQYEKSFAPPHGVRRDLAGYTSIQHQFPNVYGINAYGPPDDATTLRLAQARQLKGYLLVFEQLMADFFAQLSRAKDLFSIDRTLGQTYFHQSLRGSVPDVGALLHHDYEHRLDATLRNVDSVAERRGRFLDLLLALYGEHLNAPFLVGPPGDERAGEPLVQAKIALLEHLAHVTRDRGRGFDTMGALSARDLTGLELRSRIELGLDVLGLDARPGGPELYIVEHTLLRYGRRLRGHRHGRRRHEPSSAFVCSFTASAVLSRPPSAEEGDAFEQAARAIVRRNAPAHLALEFCFLGPAHMRRFEELHRSWRAALRHRKCRAIIHASVQLRTFLERRKKAQ